MKKLIRQILVAAAFLIIGFIFTYQTKILYSRETRIIASGKAESYDIMGELDELKKEKADYEKKNNDVLAQLKKYEDSIAKQNDLTKDITKELADSRLLLGLTEANGPGIILYINPKPEIFNEVSLNITDDELTYITNELYYAGAEAIAVNDLRLTSQSSIRMSKDLNHILVNDVSIPTDKQITIKAIGDKDILYKIIADPAISEYQSLQNYDMKTEKSDSLKLPKYNKSYNLDSMNQGKDK